MKAIIIGTSLSGKTSLVRQLRSQTDLPVSEIDEELTRLNHGQYPSDNQYKHQVLVPQVIENILSQQNMIFFTNTDYFTFKDLKKAKNKGFKIIQINVDLKELNRRNSIRVKDEGYQDLSKYFKGMLEYQDKVTQSGLVDQVVSGKQPVAKITQKILKKY